MADLSKLRYNGTDYNVKDASAPTRKFTNTYSKTGNLPISSDDTIQTAIGKLENNIIPKSEKGAANGVAELDANGKVPSSQLPSYVDDVLEYSAKSSFPATGESGKIYVDTSTNKTYRWSGSAYVEISESLALGETDSTAYRGDRGKTAYDHSQITSGNPHNVTKSDVGLGNVGNFKAVSTVASQALSDTEKSNARANIGAGTGNGTYSKPSGGIPKSDLASAVQTSLDQVNTNQTNILYTINTGVKNELDNRGVTSYTHNGITYTFNKDGSVTLKGTASGNSVFYYFVDGYVYIPNNWKGHILSGVTSGSASTYSLTAQYSNNGTSWATEANCITEPITIASNYNYINFSILVRNGVTVDATIYPMLCDPTVWAQSHDFMPPALPNYDLTYLQAEDRAALAEKIDAGAKNKWANGVSGSAVWRGTFDIGETLKTGTYIIYFGNLTSTDAEASTCQIMATNNNSEICAEWVQCSRGNNVYALLNVIKDATKIWLYSSDSSAHSDADTVSFTNGMICTKVDWDISKAYAPYRPSYQELYDRVVALENA